MVPEYHLRVIPNHKSCLMQAETLLYGPVGLPEALTALPRGLSADFRQALREAYSAAGRCFQGQVTPHSER